MVPDLSQGKVPPMHRKESPSSQHGLTRPFSSNLSFLSDGRPGHQPGPTGQKFASVGTLSSSTSTDPVVLNIFLTNTFAFFSEAPVSPSLLTPPPVSRCVKQEDAQWRFHSNKSRPGSLSVAPLRHLSPSAFRMTAQEAKWERVGGTPSWG